MTAKTASALAVAILGWVFPMQAAQQQCFAPGPDATPTPEVRSHGEHKNAHGQHKSPHGEEEHKPGGGEPGGGSAGGGHKSGGGGGPSGSISSKGGHQNSPGGASGAGGGKVAGEHKKAGPHKAKTEVASVASADTDAAADAVPLPEKGPVDTEDDDDPLAAARHLVETLQDQQDDDYNTDPKQHEPDYIAKLSTLAGKKDPAAQCWYAVWMLSESNDEDAFSNAHAMLEESASTGKCLAASVALNILDAALAGGSFHEPDAGGVSQLKSEGDGALFYYLGKAFLTGRNIVAGARPPGPDGPGVPISAQGTGRNAKAAVRILKFADEIGSSAAAVQLAIVYANGLGVQGDPALAFQYASDAVDMPLVDGRDDSPVELFKTANQDEATRQANQQLAIFYATGTGTAPDKAKASQYMAQSGGSSDSD